MDALSLAFSPWSFPRSCDYAHWVVRYLPIWEHPVALSLRMGILQSDKWGAWGSYWGYVLGRA